MNIFKLKHIPVQIGTFMHYDDLFVYRLAVETMGAHKWRVMGTVYDHTGINILAMVERDYHYINTTNYDLGNDMLELLSSAAQASFNGRVLL